MASEATIKFLALVYGSIELLAVEVGEDAAGGLHCVGRDQELVFNLIH